MNISILGVYEYVLYNVLKDMVVKWIVRPNEALTI